MDIKVVPLLVQTLEKGEESQSKKIVKALHKLGPEGILETLRIKNKIDWDSQLALPFTMSTLLSPLIPKFSYKI